MIRWLRQRFCSHVFRGVDMQGRDADGLLAWPCSKCGLVWRGAYGLQAPGKIRGPWGSID